VRHRRNWEVNIKMNIQEVGSKILDWIILFSTRTSEGVS
jgi:hypothetical protein